ncbi:MAG: hypothetical protein V4531_14860 [Actinomycetota bacterium]
MLGTGAKGRRSEVGQINGLVVDEQRRLRGRAPASEIAVELAHASRVAPAAVNRRKLPARSPSSAESDGW